MQHRFSLLFALILPLALTSCFGPPLVDEVYPYGPPRYGHQGTQSPQQPPYQQGHPPAPSEQGTGYEWQRHPNAGTGQATNHPPAGGVPNNIPSGGVPNQPGNPNNLAGGGSPTGPAPIPSKKGALGNQGSAGAPGANPGGGSSPSSKPPVVASKEEIPYGIPVPGKDGMLYSPYSPDAGLIDITTPNADGSKSVLPPGTKIKDPYSNKPILVP